MCMTYCRNHSGTLNLSGCFFRIAHKGFEEKDVTFWMKGMGAGNYDSWISSDFIMSLLLMIRLWCDNVPRGYYDIVISRVLRIDASIIGLSLCRGQADVNIQYSNQRVMGQYGIQRNGSKTSHPILSPLPQIVHCIFIKIVGARSQVISESIECTRIQVLMMKTRTWWLFRRMQTCLCAKTSQRRIDFVYVWKNRCVVWKCHYVCSQCTLPCVYSIHYTICNNNHVHHSHLIMLAHNFSKMLCLLYSNMVAVFIIV